MNASKRFLERRPGRGGSNRAGCRATLQAWCSTARSHRCPSVSWALADLLGEPDENALGASDVAKPIHVFVLDDFVDELRAVLSEPGKGFIEVVHGEHDAEVAEGVDRGVAVIGDRSGVRKRESSILPWPSGIRIMAVSTRWSRSPVTRPDQSPSIMARPSSSRPSAAKKEIAASSDSTTMPTLSIR